MGAMLCLRAHLCNICMFLDRGRFWSSKSILKVHWSHRYTMVSWGSRGLPTKKFLELNCLKHQKMSLHKIGEM